jgi:amino acid transporter
MAGSAASRDASSEGLLRGALPLPSVMAQSIAVMSPSAAVAVAPVLVFAFAGNGTWLSFAIAGVGTALIAYCIVQFSRRFASAGSFYVYAARSLGPVGGFLSGWGLLLGYLTLGMVVVLGFELYFTAFLLDLGLPGSAAAVEVVVFAAGLLVAAYLAILDIRLSTRIQLVLESLSVAVILVLVAVILVRGGLDLQQVPGTSGSFSFDAVRAGMVLAIFSFVGFESAAALGMEARAPYLAIPRAVAWSLAGAGAFLVLNAYAQVLGFHVLGSSLDKSTAPLTDLAQRFGVGFLSAPIDLGVALSMFTAVLGCVNAGARILATMAADRLLSPAVGRIHPRQRTPYIAIVCVALPMLVVPAVLIVAGNPALVVFSLLGTVSGFGFLLGYLLVALALPWLLVRTGSVPPVPVVIGLVGAAFMAFVFVSDVYPGPPPPYNLLVYVFAAWVVVGLVWFGLVRLRAPQVIEGVGGVYERNEQLQAVP